MAELQGHPWRSIGVRESCRSGCKKGECRERPVKERRWSEVVGFGAGAVVQWVAG